MRIVAVAATLLAATVGAAGAFDLQGHRGARGLLPENTLPAFAKALELGVTTLELDLAMTRDGVLVVSHDPALNPSITRRGGSFLAATGPVIRDLDWADLAAYDVGRINPASAYSRAFPDQVPVDGTRIPMLAEVLELGRSNPAVRFNIETKITPVSGAQTPTPEAFAAALVAAVEAAGLADRASIQSFDWRTLSAAARLAPHIPRVCLTAEGRQFNTVTDGSWTAGLTPGAFGGSVPRMAKAQGCSTWSPQFRDLTAARAAEARALGLKVVPWTVNDTADAEALIELGVDGLITDYPDRMKAVLSRKGLVKE